MPITPEDVLHVARLARLALGEEEQARMTAHLARILEYVDQLAELDLAGAEPLTHPLPDLVNVLREDEVRPGLAREEALAAAPDREGPYFRVPAVLEEHRAAEGEGGA